VFLTQGQLGGESSLTMHTTRWIILNYVGLVLWVFVWRTYGVWLLPFLLAPLPTLMALILFLQRRMKA
jgi:hypothetical protein